MVIPVHKNDWPVLKRNIPYIFRYLNPKSIIIISSDEVEEEIKQMDRVAFLDENRVMEGLNLQSVKTLIKKRGGNYKRAGWYFQQFLKMAYAYCCEESCFLLWDADTVPLKKIRFLYKNKYILDLKSEYHKPYFLTIKTLFGINKINRKSFIAEHMIIDRKIMLELIKAIEENKSLEGISFYEKIINAVPRKALNGSGFSEFETYGTYAVNFYRERFFLRSLNSLRAGKLLFGDSPSKKTMSWISESFDIVSFEKSQEQDKIASRICYIAEMIGIKLEHVWGIYKKVKPGVYYD